MRKLNLGCGPNKPEGYIGVDRYPYPCVDIVRDIDRHGLPFDSDSAEEVRASHFLEHCQYLVFVMNEIHRVLKTGGRVFIAVPVVGGGLGAFQDPSHVRYFTENTFRYFATDSPYCTTENLGIKRFRLLAQKVVGEEMMVELEKP